MILGHLTTTRKFDVSAAVQAGLSKPEIIDHLATTSGRVSRVEGAAKANGAPTRGGQVHP
jgi:hypothetical protein